MYTLCNRPFAVSPALHLALPREPVTGTAPERQSDRELLKHKLLIERVIKKLLSVACSTVC